MNRTYITLLLLLVAWLTGSCFSQPASAPTATSTISVTQGPDRVKVRVGYATVVGTDTEEVPPLLREQGDLFERTHPHIEIVFKPWGWNAQEFPAQLASGQVPDVMDVAATEGNLVIENGFAADITPMMNTWPVTQDFNRPILAPFAKDGRFYAVPAGIYIVGLFYDKKLFKEAGLVDDGQGEPAPPTTWAEFVDAAKAIKAKTGAAGFCIVTQQNQGGWNFMNWGWQAGGDFERRVGNRWQAVFDEPAIVEAMQFIKDLRWQHDVLQAALVLNVERLIPMIASHQCGMAMVAPDWFNSVVIDEGGNLDDLGLTILPAGPAGRANLMGGAYTIINAKAPSEVQQAAFEWITWRNFNLEVLEDQLKSPQGLARWAFTNRSLMYKPNSQTTQRERALLGKYRNLPYYRTYLEEAGKYARPEPPIATQELYAALDPVIQAVLTDQKADPQSLLSQAAKEFQTKYLDRVGK